MISSLSFFSYIAGILSEANDGLHQANDACEDQPIQFVIPKMEMHIKCIVINDNGLKILSSDAETRNYYSGKEESLLKFTFKLKPNKIN
jgi:hypothetical protein